MTDAVERRRFVYYSIMLHDLIINDYDVEITNMYETLRENEYDDFVGVVLELVGIYLKEYDDYDMPRIESFEKFYKEQNQLIKSKLKEEMEFNAYTT